MRLDGVRWGWLKPPSFLTPFGLSLSEPGHPAWFDLVAALRAEAGLSLCSDNCGEPVREAWALRRACHPATARHIATKLAIHFVADAPPQSLVDRLSARFLETDGDLKEVTTALLTSDEAWSPSRSKLKRPSEWIVSALRAVGAQPESGILVTEAQNVLGEPLWHPPEPKGFSDQSAEWTDGIAERLDIASNASQRLLLPARPADVLDQTLGPLASGETRKTIDRAADGAQALALLFMAPEFQMR